MLLVDILLIITALGLLATLLLLRRKPAATAVSGPPPRGPVPVAPENRPGNGRLAAALAATPRWNPAGPPPGPAFSPGPTAAVPAYPPLMQMAGPAAQMPGTAIQTPAAPVQTPSAAMQVPGTAIQAPASPIQANPAPHPFYPAAGSQQPPTAVLFPGAYLEVITGEEAGHRFPLAPGDNRIGRGPGNHLRLADRTVSNQHAIVRVTTGQVLLFDDSSTNGTFVNGQRVLQPRPLVPGDRITVGQTVLQFHLESTENQGGESGQPPSAHTPVHAGPHPAVRQD